MLFQNKALCFDKRWKYFSPAWYTDSPLCSFHASVAAEKHGFLERFFMSMAYVFSVVWIDAGRQQAVRKTQKPETGQTDLEENLLFYVHEHI